METMEIRVRMWRMQRIRVGMQGIEGGIEGNKSENLRIGVE